MTMIDVWVEIDGNRVAQALHEAGEKLDSAGGDVFLDFSAVRRLDPSGLRALEDFAGAADGKTVKVTLRGVNVDVYKVLKLARLSSRFSMVD
jgi:anti-anti-sigma regulatory factor